MLYNMNTKSVANTPLPSSTTKLCSLSALQEAHHSIIYNKCR